MRDRKILITEADVKKLRELLSFAKRTLTKDQQHVEELEEELQRAEVVKSEEIPGDVVTMHSHVLITDLDTGKSAAYTLVFPQDADVSESKISVLAPIGTALIGYREGDKIEWPVPGGLKRLKVVKVLYQPEAEGHESGGEAPYWIAGVALKRKSHGNGAGVRRAALEAR